MLYRAVAMKVVVFVTAAFCSSASGFILAPSFVGTVRVNCGLWGSTLWSYDGRCCVLCSGVVLSTCDTQRCSCCSRHWSVCVLMCPMEAQSSRIVGEIVHCLLPSHYNTD